MGSIHETAEGLHAAGVINKRTMREFDDLCLTPARPMKPKEIRAHRLWVGASNADNHSNGDAVHAFHSTN
jgi:putative transcriptional regulator